MWFGIEKNNQLGIMGTDGTEFQDSVTISVQRCLDGMLGHFDEVAYSSCSMSAIVLVDGIDAGRLGPLLFILESCWL